MAATTAFFAAGEPLAANLAPLRRGLYLLKLLGLRKTSRPHSLFRVVEKLLLPLGVAAGLIQHLLCQGSMYLPTLLQGWGHAFRQFRVLSRMAYIS
jgi:hypothetical protein